MFQWLCFLFQHYIIIKKDEIDKHLKRFADAIYILIPIFAPRILFFT